jgi:hypothetical protein
MVKRLHHAIVATLKSAERPDGWRSLAPLARRDARGAISPRGDSLASLFNRQIADAQLRLRGMQDCAERRAQMRLIGELQKHLDREMAGGPSLV